MALLKRAAMKCNNSDKNLPDKLFFKIGEVSKITDLPSYVLRFWEKEFSKIRPRRTSSGQRMYRKNDVELILEIKELLHEKKYTISGAKKILKKSVKVPVALSSGFLDEIRDELIRIRDIL